jgi:hypothetical protein
LIAISKLPDFILENVHHNTDTRKLE